MPEGTTSGGSRAESSDQPSYTRAGWREWVSLPDLDLPWIKAKLDTGARSSAIHAFDQAEHTVDGVRRVRFTVHPWQANADESVEIDLPVIDVREVRSSSGHAEERLVVPMTLHVVHREITAEVTLSRRDEMGFRMLVGREALRQGILVDPAVSYVGPKPPLRVRRRNRGRGGPAQ